MPRKVNIIKNTRTNAPWHPLQRNIIEMVKKHPIIYVPTCVQTVEEHTEKVNIAWESIGQMLFIESNLCRQIWADIHFEYAKITNLIKTKRITKDSVMLCPETSKFFDETLQFLFPYIQLIPDNIIPSDIHQRIDSIFGINQSAIPNSSKKLDSLFNVVEKNKSMYIFTHEQVKTMLLYRERVDRESKKTSKAEMLDMIHVQHILQHTLKGKMADILKSNSIISKATIPEQNIKPDIVENISNMEANTEVVEHYIIENNMTPDTNINYSVENDFLPNINHTPEQDEIISDECLRKFFTDLGALVSVELTREKQLLLKSQVNMLLHRTLNES